VLRGLAQLAVGGEGRALLEGPGPLQERVVGVEHHQAAVARAGADAGGPQGAGVAEGSVEPKGAQGLTGGAVALARADRDHGLARVAGRAGVGHRLQIDPEVVLGEEVLVPALGGLRDQGASGVGTLLARLAVAEGTVADRLLDHDVGIPLRLLDHLQRPLVILGVARQHRGFEDQLARGVDRDHPLVPVEGLGGALAPVAHLRIVHRDDPVRAHPLAQGGPVRLARDVLHQDLRQEVGRLDQPRALGAVGGEVREPSSGLAEETVGVGDDLPEEGPAGRRIVPVDGRLALEAAAEVAGEGVGRRVALRGSPLLAGQGAHQLDDPVGEEVVGVLDRAAPQDVAGIQGRFNLVPLEVAGPTGEGQALLEHRAHPAVDDELGEKELQRALGEGAVVEADPQRNLPAQVEGGAGGRPLVGDVVVGLQEQRGGEQARGEARPPIVGSVQRGEGLVAKDLPAPGGEEPVEGLPPDVGEIEVIGLKQAALRPALPKHRDYPLACLRRSYQTNRTNESFRPGF
jgi:hypothetical protein